MTNGARLLGDAWVASEIERRTAKIIAKEDITTREIVMGVKGIATIDARALVMRDPKTGEQRVCEPWEISDAAAHAIDGFKVKDTKYGRQIEYKLAGRLAAYELLARYKGMLKEPERPALIANIQINLGG